MARIGKTQKKITLITYLGLLASASTLATANRAQAEAVALPSGGFATEDSVGEQVNVDAIREKYWARGDESALGVVQNRLYSKESKFQIGTMGGMIMSDPFLDIKATGFSMGYHFSEYLSLSAMGWKSFSAKSQAYLELEKRQGLKNLNFVNGYTGLEAAASFMYGKISLIGKKIIYFDMNLLGGVGLTLTDSGNYLTPSMGIGQQIHISKSFSLRADYRVMRFSEYEIEQVIESQLGTRKGPRTNFSHAVTLGVSFMFGVGGGAPSPVKAPASVETKAADADAASEKDNKDKEKKKKK